MTFKYFRASFATIVAFCLALLAPAMASASGQMSYLDNGTHESRDVAQANAVLSAAHIFVTDIYRLNDGVAAYSMNRRTAVSLFDISLQRRLSALSVMVISQSKQHLLMTPGLRERMRTS